METRPTNRLTKYFRDLCEAPDLPEVPSKRRVVHTSRDRRMVLAALVVGCLVGGLVVLALSGGSHDRARPQSRPQLQPGWNPLSEKQPAGWLGAYQD